MANYHLTNEWQSLSQLLGEDYDSTKKYRIHSNIRIGLLVYSININDRGAFINFSDEIYNDVGIDLYLKTTETTDYTDNDVYITEVA